LANEVGQLMSNTNQRQTMGVAGGQVVAINRGAKQRSLRLLEQHLKAR
jgi:3-deoxy-D-manno-octulosonic-acid transferase